MTHSPHHVAPGYSPEQVLYDQCAECSQRAATFDHGLSNMDMATFERAWRRAGEWQLRGLPDAASVELPVLQTLAMVQVHLERRGVPIGALPKRQTPESPVRDAAPGLMEAYAESEGIE